MVLAAKLGIVPVIIIIAVVFTVIVWLAHFFAGIKKTNDFYRQKLKDAEAERQTDTANHPLSEQETDPTEEKAE